MNLSSLESFACPSTICILGYHRYPKFNGTALAVAPPATRQFSASLLILLLGLVLSSLFATSSLLAKTASRSPGHYSHTHPLFSEGGLLHSAGETTSFGTRMKIYPPPRQDVSGSTFRSQGAIPFEADSGDWIPNGAFIDHPLPPECQPEVLSSRLQQTSLEQQQEQASEFFSHCERTLALGETGRNRILLRMNDLNYQMSLHPQIREVEVTLADGTLLRGYLGLKPTREPRPLVISKCGLFCDSQPDSFFKFLTMHLFDEAPFHFLVIESITSPTFALANGRMGVGGVEEGHQIVEIAKYIRQKSPLSPYVGSVHTISPSLGGHAAMYASIYNDHEPSIDGQSPLQSSLALCPVVNLKPSFMDLFEGFKKGTVFTAMIRQVLSRVLPIFEDVRDQLKPAHRMNEDDLRRLLIAANFDYYSRQPESQRWAPFSEPILSEDDLWQRNNFISHHSLVRRTPTLLLAASNDWVVRSRDNTTALIEAIHNREHPNVKAVELAYGSHCAFGISYGWPQFGALLRSYVVNHSPDYHPRWHEKPLRGVSISLAPQERHMQQSWTLTEDRRAWQVTFKIWKGPELDHDQSNTGCGDTTSRYSSLDRCFREVQLRLPDGVVLPLPVRTSPSAVAEVQAQSLVRWANTNLRVVGPSGGWLIDSIEAPTWLRWQD